MNAFRKKIEARLAPLPSIDSRQIMANVSRNDLDSLTQIAKTLTAISGVKVSRNMLVQDAIDCFLANYINLEKRYFKMNEFSEKIEAMLAPSPLAEKERKQVTLPLSLRSLNSLAHLAKTMSQYAGARISRNSLIDGAIEVFVKEAQRIIETHDSQESA